MSSTIQRSFSGGELAPELHGRADQTKYQTGLRACRNAFVQRFGGVTNRPGTKFVVEVKDSDEQVRLLKFVFNADQTYVLEFGDLYMRVIRNGAQVAVSGVATWSNVTAYAVGDLASRLSVNYYCILAHTNQQPPNATYWYPLAGSVYEIPTPYTTADLQDLQFVQSGDVVTIVHPSYVPRELSRTGHTAWTLTPVTTAPVISAPTPVSATAGTPSTVVATPTGGAATGGAATGADPDKYKVTAWDVATGSESVATADIISSDGPDFEATGGANITISWSAVGAAEGYAVYKKPNGGSAYGLIAIIPAGTLSFVDNGRTPASMVRQAPVGAGGTTTFNYKVTAIKDETGEESLGSAIATCTGSAPGASTPNTVSWSAVSGAVEYNIYREKDGVYGFIGTAQGTSFADIGYDPETTIQPPPARTPYSSADNYPSTVSYFQQRLCLAATNNDPETVGASKVGDFHNFSPSIPVQDDDTLSFTIAGREVNQVRHIIELGKLIILTSGGEWTCEGDTDGVLKPTAINLRQHGYNGASALRPIIVDSTALYVQARGSIVRDLRYDLQSDGYAGRDLTIFAAHMFDGYTIRDWDWAKIPHSIVWAVRSDGALLGLTYVREHEVWGWHRHDTGDGDEFEQLVCVPEGTEDAVYVVVKRTIDGDTKRYIERFASRQVTDVAVDAVFMDSALTYDGRNAGAVTMTLSGGTSWLYTETLTLTASAATFLAADGSTLDTFATTDVDNSILLRVGTASIRVVIRSRTSSTICQVQAVATVPAALRAVATADWDKQVDTVAGLDHLEGCTVSALSDGDSTTGLEVTGGEVELPRAASVVHVGLPYLSDVETLDLESLNTETLSDKKKRINRVTVRVKDTRGLEVGDSETSTLRAPKATQATTAGDPIPLYSGLFEVVPQATWNDHGRVFIRQSAPLPMTILAITPSGAVGG
jgi:hypothetical protein